MNGIIFGRNGTGIMFTFRKMFNLSSVSSVHGFRTRFNEFLFETMFKSKF